MSTVTRKVITSTIKVVVDPVNQQTSLGNTSQSSLIIEPPFLMTQAAAEVTRVAEATAAQQTQTLGDAKTLESTAVSVQRDAAQAVAANAAPVVTDEYLAVTAGVPISGPASILLSNDTDPDGEVLTIVRYGQPSHGVLVQGADGTLTYTASANYSGADSFTYTVSDGQGNETIGTVFLTVQGGGNQAPIVQGESVTVQAGVPATGTPAMLLANDSDPNGDTLTIARYGQPAHGTLTQNPDGTITYLANANYSGVDSFTYVVSDGQGNESAGTVTLTVTPAANTAPTAVNDNATVAQDGSVTIAVLSNDSDPEGDTLSVSAVGSANQGVATLNADGRITYVPNAGFTGVDSFSYTIADGKGGSSTAQVTVTVQAGAPDLLASADTGLSNSDNITANTRPGFTIPAPPAGSMAVLLVDGVQVAATYNATAKTLTPSLALSEGPHQIAYGYRPTAGGALTLTSAPLNIDIDAVKEAPTAAIDLIAASDSGGSNTDNITNLTRPIFNVGPLPKAGDVFNLYVNGSRVAATYDAAAGTLTPVNALSAATLSVTYTLTNAAGVESARSPALSLVVDTTAPNTYLNSFASKLTAATDLGLNNADGITSNTRPSLANQALTSSYFGEAGAVGTASLFVNGVKVASVWDKVAGTLTPVNALPDGQHTLSFSRTDSAGNETAVSTRSYRITVDTSTPVAPTLTPDMLATADSGSSNSDNITSNTRPGFVVGDPQPGGRIDLLVDGVVVAATYNASTKTLTPSVALSEGAHTIAIVNVSAAGAQSAASPALTIDIDAVKETPALIDLAEASDSGGSNTDNITNLTRPIFNVGPLPKAGDVFNLYVNGSRVAATYDAAAGTLTPVNALSAATLSVTYTLTNAAGVESARSPALSLVVDTTAPNTYLNSFASKLTAATDLGLNNADGITSNTRPSLANQALTSSYFGEAGAVGTASLFVNGVKVASVWDKVAGTLTPVNALPDGQHTLSFSRTDSAGNETAVSTRSYRITVDTSTPVAPTLTPDMLATADSGSSNSDNITSNTRPGFVVGDPQPGGRIDLLVDGVVVAATYNASTKTLTPSVALSEGAHTIAIVNVSAAGAQSAASPALTIDIDAVKETPALIDLAEASDSGGSNTDNITNLTRPIFNVGPLPKAGDVFNLYVNGSRVAATYDAAAGTLTPVNALRAATHSVTYTLTNAAGVESARSPALSLVIDTTAPTAPIAPDLQASSDSGSSSTDNITAINVPGFALGTIAATDQPSLWINGVEVAATFDRATRTITPVSALPDGVHQVTVRVSDAAGNVSQPSAALNVDIRTQAPLPSAAPELQAAFVISGEDQRGLTGSNQPGFNVPRAPASCTAVLYVDGIKIDATYNANTLTPKSVLGEGNHLITYAWVDQATGAESQLSPALPIRIAFNPVIAGSEGQDVLAVAVDRDETIVTRNLGGGANQDELSTPTWDQAFLGLGGNDLVQAGDGDDWVHLGASGSNIHNTTGQVATTADVARTALMSEDDWKLIDSVGGLATGMLNNNNSQTDTNTITAWADVANGGWGRDIIFGGAGTDLIYGAFDDDVLEGGDGSDGLRGGNGDDTLIGGRGNDVMRGDDGSDTFFWRSGDKGDVGTPERDQIMDFSAMDFAEGGDVLDLRDLLVGEAFGPNGSVGNLANFLEFDTSSSPGTTLIHISSKGQFTNGIYSAAAEDMTISLNGVDIRSALDLSAQATDTQLIEELLKRGNLIAGG
ncbi:MAG: Ig-like domain-containing protein [Ideonella sp.]|nr:Ig-like domain-containing protein [Ideonella sp.]